MYTITIFGGGGFVGSNLFVYLINMHPAYTIIVCDNLKRKGSELNLNRIKDLGIRFIHLDIRNKSDFEALPPSDFVIDAAAEPSAFAGAESGLNYLLETNVTCSFNIF